MFLKSDLKPALKSVENFDFEELEVSDTLQELLAAEKEINISKSLKIGDLLNETKVAAIQNNSIYCYSDDYKGYKFIIKNKNMTKEIKEMIKKAVIRLMNARYSLVVNEFIDSKTCSCRVVASSDPQVMKPLEKKWELYNLIKEGLKKGEDILLRASVTKIIKKEVIVFDEYTEKRRTEEEAYIIVNIAGTGLKGIIGISEWDYNFDTYASLSSVKEGTVIEVKATNIARNKYSLAIGCSRKAVLKNPWEDIEQLYPKNSLVNARCVQKRKRNVLMQLEKEDRVRCFCTYPHNVEVSEGKLYTVIIIKCNAQRKEFIGRILAENSMEDGENID